MTLRQFLRRSRSISDPPASERALIQFAHYPASPVSSRAVVTNRDRRLEVARSTTAQLEAEMFHASLLASLSLLCLTVPAQAGPREDADARTALELQLALQRVPKTQTVKPLPAPKPDYATAYAAALTAGKPLVVHVAGFDCKDCCRECAESGACKVCQSGPMFGDSTPRMILAKPSGIGFVFVREWKTPPSQATLKTALGACSADCPNGQCSPGNCADCPNCVPATKGISTFDAGGCSSGQCGQSSGGFRLFRR